MSETKPLDTASEQPPGPSTGHRGLDEILRRGEPGRYPAYLTPHVLHSRLAAVHGDVEIWCAGCQRTYSTPQPPSVLRWLDEHRQYGFCRRAKNYAWEAEDLQSRPGVAR